MQNNGNGHSNGNGHLSLHTAPLDLSTWERGEREDLNHAGGSLSAHNEKWISLGYTVALRAQLRAELVVGLGLDGITTRRWQGWLDQANRLVDGYQEDIKIVLRDTPQVQAKVALDTAAERAVEAIAQEAERILGQSDEGKSMLKIPMPTREAICRDALDIPAGVTKTAWYQEVANTYKVSLTSVKVLAAYGPTAAIRPRKPKVQQG